MTIDLSRTAALTTLPTPLEEAPRLSSELGARILIKRDDLTGLGLGGNKVRKLDYLMRDAMDRGTTTVVTAGGAQSNFARMTAAAATRLGMACHLVLAGDPPKRETANIMLDRLFGAELHFAGTHDWTALNENVRTLAASLGRDAYPMPIGGATPVGSLGYVAAARELLEQLAHPPDWIVHASSSGGTQAGLLAGLPASVRVLGVDVARPPVPLADTVRTLAERTAALIGRDEDLGAVEIVDHTGPAYAEITDECRGAVRLAARTEGLVLDPVYSGKGMAGVIAAVREGRIGGTIVFIHTGGAPALFAEEYAAF